MERYAHYRTLKITRAEPGILDIAMGEEGRLAIADATGHRELADVWRDVDADPETSVVIIRGLGKGFSGGGSLELVEALANDFETRARVWRAARQGSRGRTTSRAGIANRAALDEVQPEQLAADGGPRVRCVAGSGDARFLRTRRPRRTCVAARKTCAKIRRGQPVLKRMRS